MVYVQQRHDHPRRNQSLCEYSTAIFTLRRNQPLCKYSTAIFTPCRSQRERRRQSLPGGAFSTTRYYVEVVKKHSGKKASSGLAPDTAVVGDGNVIGSRAAIYHKLKSRANVSEDVLQGGGGGAEPGESGERDGAGEPPAGYSIV